MDPPERPIRTLEDDLDSLREALLAQGFPPEAAEARVAQLRAEVEEMARRQRNRPAVPGGDDAPAGA